MERIKYVPVGFSSFSFDKSLEFKNVRGSARACVSGERSRTFFVFDTLANNSNNLHVLCVCLERCKFERKKYAVLGFMKTTTFMNVAL